MLTLLHIEISDAAGKCQLQLPSAPPETPHLVGTDPSCAARLSGDGVSATHAELFHDGEHWCVRDLASAAGTFIDDNRLFASAIRLEIGQRVRFGAWDGGATVTIVAGAHAPRAGVDLRVEVAAVVKKEKREAKQRLRRRRLALPSVAVIVIAAFWVVGALIVTQRRAALRADPNLASADESNTAATDRLAAIMAGEAGPEDVDVQQIIRDASLGRPTEIADAAFGMFRPSRSAASGSPAVRETKSSPDASASASLEDERALAALIARRMNAPAAADAAIEQEIVARSRAITVRRLHGLIDEREQLRRSGADAPRPAADAKRAAEIDRRLASLGIDAAKLGWNAGGSVEALEAKIDVAALERVRQKLIAAMSGG